MLQVTFVNLNKPPIWLVKPHYTIGSESSCDLCLSGPGVLPLHAELIVENDAVSLEPAVGAQVHVNARPAVGRTLLGHDVSVQLGQVHLRVIDPKRRIANAQPVAPGWLLQSKTLALAKSQYPLERPLTVGRAKSCGICLSIAHLSREHARLSPGRDGVEVEDLNSSNGTFINGRRITKAIARAGDEIAFDSLKFEVVHVHQQPFDMEATSLRPTISGDQLASYRPSEPAVQTPPPVRKAASAPASQPSLGAQPVSSALPDERRSPVPLIAGLALVLLATFALLFYLTT